MTEAASSDTSSLPGAGVLAAVLDELSSAVALIDNQLTVLYANKKFCVAHQYPDLDSIRGVTLKAALDQVMPFIPRSDGTDVRHELMAQARVADGISRKFVTSERRHLEWCFTRIDDQHVLFTLESVTALERERQQLNDKSRLFELILNEMSEGVTVIDPNEQLVVANGGYRRMYGFEAGQLRVGTPIAEVFRQDIARNQSLTERDIDDLVQKRLKGLRQTKINTTSETDARLPDGRTVKVSRYRSHDGYLVTTFFDTTAQAAAQAELEQSERRYKGILDAQTELVSRLDRDFNILYANAAYRRTFLPDPESPVIGRNIASAFADRASAEAYFAKMKALTPDDPVLRAEVEQPVADGTHRWHSWSEQAIFDREGQLSGFQSVGRDITDRKRAQDQLAETLMERNAILNAAFDGIVSIDHHGCIRSCNPAARELLGYTEEQITSKPLHALFSASQSSSSLARALHSFPDGDSVDQLGQSKTAVNWLHQNGDELPLDTVLVDASTANQTLYVAYVRDLRPEKANAARLAEHRAAISQAEKLSALGTMLANVAHELNNPLAIVLGQATILAESTHDERILNRTERIRLAAERCSSTVKSLLAVSRKKETDYQPMEPLALVNNTLELTGDAIRTSGIALQVAVQEHLPSLIGDATQIGQILSNLLINAQHALASIEGVKVIEFSATHQSAFVEFVVQDNGPGIPPDAHNKIFEPFFTTKVDGKGTGIGLSIARSLAEAHGGSLSAESVPSGAKMVLRLPVPATQPVARTTERTVISTKQEELSARVLIVDDEADVAELIADYLMLAGCEIDIVTDGEEALSKLDEHPFDAVLTDFRMPGLDGPAFYERVRTLMPGFERRVGFVTGDLMNPNVQQFIETNQCCFTEKPFNYESLLNLVQTLIDR